MHDQLATDSTRPGTAVACVIGGGVAAGAEVAWVSSTLAPSVGDQLLAWGASAVSVGPAALVVFWLARPPLRSFLLAVVSAGAWLSTLHGEWLIAAAAFLWGLGTLRLDLRLAAVANALVVAWACWPGPGPSAGPRTMLVTVEGLRADAWPALRAIEAGASGGRQATAVTPSTNVEVALDALLLGRVPWDTGGESLAVGAQRRGCATGAFLSRHMQARAGFDQRDDALASLPLLSRLGIGRALGLSEPQERPAWETAAAARRWLRSARGCAFAWVHLTDPTPPLAPPPPWDQRFYTGRDPHAPSHSGLPQPLTAHFPGITDPAWVRAQYAGEVGVVDAAVASLLAELPHDATVVVVGVGGLSLQSLTATFEPASLEVALAMRGARAAPEPPVGLADVYDWLAGAPVEARPWAEQGDARGVLAVGAWRIQADQGPRDHFPSTEPGDRARRGLLLDVAWQRFEAARLPD